MVAARSLDSSARNRSIQDGQPAEADFQEWIDRRMIRFTLRQLEYFEAAADTKSIAAAAGKMNISQPSVSNAISKLEAQLGVDLFIRRHAQGVLLTKAGQQVLKDARALLRHARELQFDASQSHGPIHGGIALGCFSTLAPVYLPNLISGFCSLYPGVTISLEEGTQLDLMRMLRSGEIEIALLYDLELPDDIVVEKLAACYPYALLPADHRLAKKKAIRLEWLAEEPMILLDIPPSREYFIGLFHAAGLKPKIGFSTHSLEMLRGMVGQGRGYSVLVTRPHGNTTYDGQNIALRPISNKTAPSVICLARLEQVRPTRLNDAFQEYCKEKFVTLTNGKAG